MHPCHVDTNLAFFSVVVFSFVSCFLKSNDRRH